MVDEADKDGTGLLTEKEFMQSSATEVWSYNTYRFIIYVIIKDCVFRWYGNLSLIFIISIGFEQR